MWQALVVVEFFEQSLTATHLVGVRAKDNDVVRIYSFHLGNNGVSKHKSAAASEEVP